MQAPAVVKPHTLRDLCPVDVSQLTRQVAQLSDAVWTALDAAKENKFAVLGHTRHIIFRFFHPAEDPRRFVSHSIWHAWRESLMAVMAPVGATYGYAQPEFPKVMLASLPPGGVIHPHTDGAGGNLLTHKIHVPLTTNPGVTFTIRDEVFHLDVGRAYEVNNIARHGGANHGTEARVHLIFEVFDRAGLD